MRYSANTIESEDSIPRGCASRARHQSLWCKRQLERDPLKSRLEKLVRWMQHYLPNRDLLIVGYWTDWSYLNTVFEQAVVSSEPRSLILVDPSTQEKLSEKSPALWSWATKRADFMHVQASGDEFLEELRGCVSANHIASAWRGGIESFAYVAGDNSIDHQIKRLEKLPTDGLYSIRRDLEGISSTSIVRNLVADSSQSLIGAMQPRIMW